MTTISPEFSSIVPLSDIVGALDRLGDRPDAAQVAEILRHTPLEFSQVEPALKPCDTGYCRQRVGRSDAYEILLMTWLPGQSTLAHDHSGSVAIFKILQGTARKTIFHRASDSLVDPIVIRELETGEVCIDEGHTIHAIDNPHSAPAPLVSLHVYCPPLPEQRRFTIREPGHAPAAAFTRRHASPSLPVVAILGGGFSGSMVAAQLIERASRDARPVHVVIIDRQPSIAEGTAYRTSESAHLLNVPARAMSAWPDRPDDLLEWARRRDPSVGPETFLARRAYGEYLRDTLFTAAAHAPTHVSLEIRRDEAMRLERRTAVGWTVRCRSGQPIEADALVLATGHRHVADPLVHCWSGVRTRYIEEPWSSMALSSIASGESVCLLGTGLTAIDVLQSLTQRPRSAPVVAVSRRGLLPNVHAALPRPSADPRHWLEPMLQAQPSIKITTLTTAIRRAIASGAAAGQDWRQVIDGLRPYISRCWRALAPLEVDRFLRHARPFWEVARHRIAPSVADAVAEIGKSGMFRTAAARVLTARGGPDGVILTVRRRGAATPEMLKFDWVVNCTGPASGHGVGLPLLLQDLIQARFLEEDARGLGVCTSAAGRATVGGREVEDLLVIGSLRKGDLWESTAVPELRVQAAGTAEALLNLPAIMSAWGLHPPT